MLPLVVIAVTIVALVVLVAWARVHPLLAYILVSAAAGLAAKPLPAAELAGVATSIVTSLPPALLLAAARSRR